MAVSGVVLVDANVIIEAVRTACWPAITGHLTESWILCSPDKASVRAAVTLGCGDRLCSLEDLARIVGTRPDPPLRHQFTSEWLRSFRTKVRLGGL